MSAEEDLFVKKRCFGAGTGSAQVQAVRRHRQCAGTGSAQVQAIEGRRVGRCGS